MKGYLLNFYKFSPSYNESMSMSVAEKFNRSIVWSAFDRLEIKNINEFAEYRKSDDGEKNWLGERQFAMLYELKEDYKLRFNATTDECKFVLDLANGGDNKKIRFFVITFIDFTQSFHAFFYGQADSGSCMHGTVTDAINSLIEKLRIPQDEIAFDVYGALGGQDLAIIWLTNQFEYVAEVLESLRDSSTEDGIIAIANVSSIVGINDVNSSDVCFDDIKGKLVVRLTKKETYDHQEFTKAIEGIFGSEFKDEELKFHMLFGEYDLLFEIPANKFIPQLYKRGGLFNTKSRQFSQNFIQSKTEIMISDNRVDKIGYKFPMKVSQSRSERCLDLGAQSKQLFRKIEDIISTECFKRADYLQETLWLLYEDFLKNITSSFSYPWSCDLHYQFEESMNYLSALVKSGVPKYKIYDNIHSIIRGMRRMMLHIAQANRLFFEVPNTHLNHTGSYSKILHMYYGVVKKYLELSYCISKYDSQSSIVPFISFDVTPIANSEYCNFIEDYPNNIVRIELPYDALVNIPKYIKLLSHEIYHYISPRNRKERNLLVASISFSLKIGEIAHQYMENELAEKWEKDQSNNWLISFQNIVRGYALNYFVDNTGCLDHYIKNSECVWDAYFEQFDSFFKSHFFEDKIFLELLYKWMNDAINKINNESTDGNIVIDEKKFYQKIADSKDKLMRHLVHYPLDGDIRYALREASADYFMLQVTEMPFEEYITYLADYQELMDSDGDDIAQRARCTFGIDLYLQKKIEEETQSIKSGSIEYNNKVYEILKECSHFSDDRAEKLARDYLEIKTAFRIYDKAFAAYFKELDFNDIKRYSKKFEEQLETTRKLLESIPEKDFLNNVKYVEKFQNQKTLQELEKIKEDYGRIPTKRPEIDLGDVKVDLEKLKFERKTMLLTKVSNLIGLLEAISREIRSISEEGETQIWFRGHENIDYLLIPSLYRMKDKKKHFYAGAGSRREMLGGLLDLFKAKAYNAPELIDKMLNDDARAIAAMQHYVLPTNLLDWSTSVFAGIYFALKHEIDEQKIRDEEDAVVYILNPIRMNVVRNRIFKSNILNVDIHKQIQYPIPVITANNSLFNGYLPASKEDAKGAILPIAAYVPYDNSRIKAQLGTFTIFGLDNQRDCCGNEIQEDETERQIDYSRCSLWDMQEKYEEACKTNKNWKFEKFLARVVINGKCKLEIAKSLRILGITKSVYFPELENLSRDMMSQVEQYLKIVDKEEG